MGIRSKTTYRCGTQTTTSGAKSTTCQKKALEYWTEYDADLKGDYGKRKARRDEFAEVNGP